VFVHADGKESPFDGDGTIGTITRLNGEAKSHREAKEAAETRVKLFEGIDDAEAARKALETVKNIKDGDLIQAGKVEEIKAAAKRAAEEQVEAANKQFVAELAKTKTERDALQNQLYDEKIGGSFDRSKFIADKLAIPGDIAKAARSRSKTERWLHTTRPAIRFSPAHGSANSPTSTKHSKRSSKVIRTVIRS
jgi:hypothetical protein